MVGVKFYDEIDDALLKFAVVIAKKQTKDGFVVRRGIC